MKPLIYKAKIDWFCEYQHPERGITITRWNTWRAAFEFGCLVWYNEQNEAWFTSIISKVESKRYLN